MSDADVTLGSLIRNYVAQELGGLRVACPGRLVSYDPATQRCSVRPAISHRVGDDEIELPVLEDVPVNFMTGGGCVVAFPMRVDDVVEIRFSDRALDDWRGSGAFLKASDPRTHALADAYVVPFGVVPDSAVDTRVSETDLVVAGPTGTIVTMRPDGTVLVDGADVRLGGLTALALTSDPPLQVALKALLPLLNQIAATVAALGVSVTTIGALPPIAGAIVAVPGGAAALGGGPAAATALVASTTSFAAAWPTPTATTKAKGV